MKQYEKIIQRKLRDAEQPFSSDLWDRIELQLSAQNPKSKTFFWITLAILWLITAMGIATLFNQNERLKSETKIYAANHVLTSSDNCIKSIDPSNTKYSNTSASVHLHTHAKLSDRYDTGIIDISALNPQPLTRGEEILNPSNALAPYHKNDITATSSEKNAKSGSFAISNFAAVLLKPHLDNYVHSDIKLIIEPSTLSWIEDTENSLVNQILPNTSELNNPSYSQNHNTRLHPLEVLNITNPLIITKKEDIPTISDQLSFKKLSKRDILNNEECLGFNNATSGLFLEAYYSSELPVRSLTDKTGDNGEHLNNRIQTEKASYSYSYGVRAKYALDNSLFIKSGFNFSFINEKLNYQDPDGIRYQTVIKIDSMLVDDHWQTTRDTTEVPVAGLEITNIMNRYRTIDLPIMLGYEWHVTKRWTAYGQIGALINLKFSQRGSYVSSTTSKPIPFNDITGEEISMFKDRLSASLIGGFGAMYHWTRELSVFVEPEFRYFTGSISSDNYVLDQSYVVMGLSTGVQIKF